MITPRCKRGDDRHQFAACLRQHVAISMWPLRVALAIDDAVANELVKAG